MIEIKNLRFAYNKKANVYDDLNLTFKENCIYGLLGKNGMGKSTLLYLISGLLSPQSGRLLVDGKQPNKRTPDFLSDIYLVPEEFDLPKMSLKQFTQYHKDFYPNFSFEQLKRCLRDFELAEDLDLKALSLGDKKKVFMSFALASGTKILLMDEPTNGLDIPSKSLFRKVIAGSMSEDRILVISTHQVHDVESLLDHIVILDHQKVLFNASIADITARYDFKYRHQSEQSEGVLYAEPALQGNAIITPHHENDEETPLNLELFFNAITKGALNEHV